MKRSVQVKLAILSFILWGTACREKQSVKYQYIQPDYSLDAIYATQDTIKFPFDSASYNKIKSFNYFTNKENGFIAFYDSQSQTVSIYDFQSGKFVKKISIQKCFPGQQLVKTTVFVKNFDSIVISNNTNLYILDTAYTVKKMIAGMQQPFTVVPSVTAFTPPVIQGNTVFTKGRPWISKKNVDNLKEWKTMCRFDIPNTKVTACYSLPESYQNNIYSTAFFEFNYCYNDSNKFVFSFPADSNLYETDLGDYQVAYFAKSRYNKDPITPLKKEEVSSEEEGKPFLTRDSYYGVYFDPVHKRYLRGAERKISLKEYDDRNWKKAHSLIIFDENFKIIGESDVDKDISLSTLFFTKEGNIYARTMTDDEKTIYFVRLSYRNNNSSASLSKQ